MFTLFPSGRSGRPSPQTMTGMSCTSLPSIRRLLHCGLEVDVFCVIAGRIDIGDVGRNQLLRSDVTLRYPWSNCIVGVEVDMLCVPPWRQAVFADLVPHCAQADSQHLRSVRAIAVGESERIFEMSPLDLPYRSARGQFIFC